MGDLAQQSGFELPTYDDIVDKLGKSGNDKLEKAAQILAETQATHMVLSNFNAYKSFINKLGSSVFDPVTNTLQQVGESVNNVVGKLPIPEGTTVNDLVAAAKNPTKIVSAVKNKIASELPGSENLGEGQQEFMNVASQFAKRAKISGRVLGDVQDTITQQFNKMPADIRQTLKDYGLSDEEIKQGIAGKDLNLENIIKNVKQQTKFDDPFSNTESDISAEELGKLYRVRKFIAKLKENPEETGAMRGDTILARVLGKGKQMANEAAENIKQPVRQMESDVTDLLKQKTRSAPKSQVGETQAQPRSEIEPAEAPQQATIQKSTAEEFQDIPEISLNDGAQLAKEAIMNKAAQLAALPEDSTVSTVAGKVTSVAGKLAGLTEDTAALDETPVGDLINAALGVATIGTMIAGLFEKHPHITPTVQGMQIGV